MAEEPPDTLDARMEAATRYAEMYNVQSRIDAMVANATKGLASEERVQISSLIRKHLRFDVLRKLQIETMANSFTFRELNALIGFCQTEEGRSILSKYGTYMSTVLPAVNAEVERAFNEIKAEMKAKKQIG
ncbi:MAG: hypothetical protein ABJD53_15320 [Gammaproteobacteria bacterium]